MSAKRIRQLLRSTPDGMTVLQLEEKLQLKSNSSVRASLLRMPDVYIDRWLVSKGPYTAVWCAVAVPEDCPHPNDRRVKR